MCVCIFCSMNFSSVLAAGYSRLIGRQFLLMLLSLPGFGIGMIIALCHVSAMCPVEIEDVSEIFDGIVSGLIWVEDTHPVWSVGCGRFGQSNRIFCVGRRERRRSC